VKAVERRNDGDPVTSLFADQPDQRSREPRLAGTRRPGDSEQESPPRCVDCREQVAGQASNDRVRFAPIRCSMRPRD
jgi:hypothetical protein